MTVQVAVIGCGAWGRNLVRNFHQLGALAAIVDADQAVAKAMQEDFGVAARTLEEVLSDKSITGVVCALAARHHFKVGKQILEAGKHLYVEKPMTLSYLEAQELADMADQKGLMIMVGHLPRYHPCFQRLHDLVRMGEVGQVRYIYSHRLGLGRIRGDENCLWDLAPHDLSMIMSLTVSEPVSTQTSNSCNLEPGLVDTSIVHLEFEGGVKAHIYNSWMHPFKEHRFTVIGSDGMIVFDDCQTWENKLAVYHHDIRKVSDLDYITQMEPGVLVPVDPGEPLRVECQHFLDCMTDGREPLTGSVEALRVMKVLEKIVPKNGE